jgi:hypothetical protein
MDFQVMDDEEELDFKMYIVKGEKGQPLIVLEFHGIETMERAEILAEEIYKTLIPEEDKVIN